MILLSGWSVGRVVFGWLAAAAATALLYVRGRNVLPVPPLAHASQVPGWWSRAGPVLATFGVVRVVLLGVSCYLGVLWLAALFVTALRRTKPLNFSIRLPLPGARMVAGTVFGLTAASATSTLLPGNAEASPAAAPNPASGLAATTSAGAPTAPPVLRYLGPPVPSVPGPTAIARRPLRASPGFSVRPVPIKTRAGPKVRSHRAPSASLTPPTTASTPETPPLSMPALLPRAPTPAGPTAAKEPRQPGGAGRRPTTGSSPAVGMAADWMVRPGDNMWTIAAHTLAATWGRPPDNSEIARYWLQVVAVNRPHLPNPADANLIFAGDRIILPAPPPDPALGARGG